MTVVVGLAVLGVLLAAGRAASCEGSGSGSENGRGIGNGSGVGAGVIVVADAAGTAIVC